MWDTYLYLVNMASGAGHVPNTSRQRSFEKLTIVGQSALQPDHLLQVEHLTESSLELLPRHFGVPLPLDLFANDQRALPVVLSIATFGNETSVDHFETQTFGDQFADLTVLQP